ncbi:MAG: LysM peptidoglycan-binding domain-containing protein [Bacteroidales bacterium]
MRKFFLLVILTLSVATSNFAAVETNKPTAKDTIRDEAIVFPGPLKANTDELLSNWLTSNLLILDKNCIQNSVNPEVSDSVYLERLSKLPTVIEMPYNQIVRSYINLYAQRLRDRVSYMMGLSRFYFPIFEQALDAENMPFELKYLPVIESALNPSATSRVGAAGLWQFMIPTGKMYGLEINSLVDERRDPIKSTYVAVRYLKNLYRIYGDWGLAIAAYNCGPGNVNKAIRRSGGKKDYWEIYFHLPKETRGYLPAFIAVNYLMSYPSEHNICEAKCKIPMNTDTVEVNEMVHFQQISDVLHIPIEEIRTLNPTYRRDLIPGNLKPYTLRLPMFSAYAFIEQRDSVEKYRADEFLLNFRKTVDPTVAEGDQFKTTITHKVKRGETIQQIAKRYDVAVWEIKEWNHLRSTKLAKGRYIKIQREKELRQPIKNNEELASHVKTKAADTLKVTTDSVVVAENESGEKSEKLSLKSKLHGFCYHTVRRGDTLWAIANRYPGISVKEIMAANRLRRHSDIQVGMKIKIPKA